jgi:rRNA maturation endonuclease Nob1
MIQSNALMLILNCSSNNVSNSIRSVYSWRVFCISSF